MKTFLASLPAATLLLGASLFISAFSACRENAPNASGKGENSPSLSGDMINNPRTADPNVATIDQATVPVMTFDRDKWEFGEIVQGEKVEYSFRFTNTGKSPLVITSAKSSCGCTAPEWPKEPVAPGESGFIKVVYDSQGRKDAFNKTVTITANTVPNTNQLYISGTVIVPQSE